MGASRRRRAPPSSVRRGASVEVPGVSVGAIGVAWAHGAPGTRPPTRGRGIAVGYGRRGVRCTHRNKGRQRCFLVLRTVADSELAVATDAEAVTHHDGSERRDVVSCLAILAREKHSKAAADAERKLIPQIR